MNTNLVLADESIIKFLTDNGVSVAARIDGHRAMHDVFQRDRDGNSTFDLVIEHAKLLLKHQPNAKVTMAVTPQTIEHYATAVAYLYDIGFRQIKAVFPAGEPWPSESFGQLQIQVQAVTDWWMAKAEQGEWVHLDYVDDYLERLTHKIIDHCNAGWTRYAIDGLGDIYPCHRFCGHLLWRIGASDAGVDDDVTAEMFKKAFVTDWSDRCTSCELFGKCRRPCLWTVATSGNLKRMTDGLQVIPPAEFCQIERIHYTEALRCFHMLRTRNLKPVYKLKNIALPKLPGDVVIETSVVEKEKTEVTQLPPAAERIKDRTKHPFGVDPGEPPPAQTDKVFTTLAPDFLVSVVYASKNEGEEVYETVKSALDAATGPVEVIVVDDASNDHSCDKIEELSSPNRMVTWIRLNRSVGAGMARNIGFSAAKGRVVVSSDAHMRYPHGLWHEIGGFCIEKQVIACPGCAAMYGGAQGWGAKLNYHRDGKIGCAYYRAQGTEPEKTTGVLGACYFVPREIFDELVRWPSLLGKWGYEESAISTWAWMHGIDCYCFPKYIARHLYRSEAAKGTKEPPWGYPPASDLNLNHACNHLALFDKETYEKIWKPNYVPILSTSQQQTLNAMENGKMYETGHWRKRRVHTDYECFRDLLMVPAVKGDGESVTKVRPISVIMTAYNEGKEVEMTVRSIVNSGQTRFDIVIVDDASTDGSVPNDLADIIRPRLAAHWRPDIQDRIKIIRNKQRMGVSRSRAIAIDHAAGEMICVMDAHQRVITPYGIEWAAAMANDVDGIVVVSVCNLGNTRSSDEKVRDARTYGARFVVKPKWGLINSHISTRPDTPLVQRDAIIGAGYVLSRDVIARMGGWPTLPGLWAYQEQAVGLIAWIRDIPMYAFRDVTFEHMYKKGTIPVPHVGVLQNAHLIHYVFFGDEAYAYFKPILMQHGYDPSIDVLLQSDGVQRVRAMWAEEKARRGKTDQAFFKDKLKIDEWPPVWKNQGQ
jgi:radical SAM protein with 4Fe4S-binding SPASM domain